jgi:hypothetical protein
LWELYYKAGFFLEGVAPYSILSKEGGTFLAKRKQETGIFSFLMVR